MNYCYTQCENWIWIRSLFSQVENTAKWRNTFLSVRIAIAIMVGGLKSTFNVDQSSPSSLLPSSTGNRTLGHTEKRRAQLLPSQVFRVLWAVDLHNFNEVSFLSSAQPCIKLKGGTKVCIEPKKESKLILSWNRRRWGLDGSLTQFCMLWGWRLWYTDLESNRWNQLSLTWQWWRRNRFDLWFLQRSVSV